MNIKKIVTEYFLTKDAEHVLDDMNIIDFNYVESTFFTSIQFIEMISEFEQEFSVTFTDEQFKSKDFSTVGGIIKLIKELLKADESCAN